MATPNEPTAETKPDIRYGLGQSWLGRVLVAQSEKGLCAILLGDDADALVQDLHERFPNVRIERGDAAFTTVVSQVIRFLENQDPELSLALDVRGTSFQQRVWDALVAVPAGQTITYTEMAKRLGDPGSVRAVAAACAANALAVVVPCHRAVRADGGLAGYRWGLERKRALLEREGQGIIGRNNPGAVHQLSLFAF